MTSIEVNRSGSEPESRVSVGWDLRGTYGLCEAAFADAMRRHRLRHLRRGQFAAAAGGLAAVEELGELILSQQRPRVALRLLQFGQGAFAFLKNGRGSIELEVAASDLDQLDRTYNEIARHLEPADPPENLVPLTFWANGKHGASSAHRRIDAPIWDEIAPNHPAGTQRRLKSLMEAAGPGGGRLVLWHGDAGTGKTHALKALVRQWRNWCASHFISDPETFLGEGTSYLLDVLTAPDGDNSQETEWKLLILEDAGELLSADARERTGQALSRLLNITDGLLGQGMHALVLVTTNEPLRRLHPAIQRPGRCWAEVEFSPLSTSEANEWLASRDCAVRVHNATPIAELFAILRGHEPLEHAPFGFAGAA